jgi:D-glycero-alpha-D-manno-heptose-7-phosphate kinase
MVGQRHERCAVSHERVFRTKAPVRLDFAGGWTDVAPFATRERGVVVNAAIELCAHAEVQFGSDGFLLEADDLDRRTRVKGAWTAAQSADFALQKAALQRSRVEACALRTRTEVPSGSGLGSSGALGVALVAALDAAQAIGRKPVELAESAFQLEAVDAALPGGKQDQYAAALGGFHKFGFTGDTVAVEPLALDPAFAAALEHGIIVCYTGTSRVSSRTITRVMSAYEAGDAAVVGALRGMAELAERMSEALAASDLAAVGRLLSKNWHCQQQLDRGMCTEPMARLEAAMHAAGALGGKAAGAGAGGSMFFLAAGDPAEAIHAAAAVGARVLPFRWASQGVRTT